MVLARSAQRATGEGGNVARPRATWAIVELVASDPDPGGRAACEGAARGRMGRVGALLRKRHCAETRTYGGGGFASRASRSAARFVALVDMARPLKPRPLACASKRVHPLHFTAVLFGRCATISSRGRCGRARRGIELSGCCSKRITRSNIFRTAASDGRPRWSSRSGAGFSISRLVNIRDGRGAVRPETARVGSSPRPR
jgi:hypothetical protein